MKDNENCFLNPGCMGWDEAGGNTNVVLWHLLILHCYYMQVWTHPPNRRPRVAQPRVVQYILSSEGLLRNNLKNFKIVENINNLKRLKMFPEPPQPFPTS